MDCCRADDDEDHQRKQLHCCRRTDESRTVRDSADVDECYAANDADYDYGTHQHHEGWWEQGRKHIPQSSGDTSTGKYAAHPEKGPGDVAYERSEGRFDEAIRSTASWNPAAALGKTN